MFKTLTQAVRRMLAGSSPSANLTREFAEAIGDPLVLPLLLELKLQSGRSPFPLSLAAALYGHLRIEPLGVRQLIVAEMLADAAGQPSHLELSDQGGGAALADQTPALTPTNRMRFRLVGITPVPVVGAEPADGSVPFTTALEVSGLTPASLVALYRVAAGEPVEMAAVVEGHDLEGGNHV